MEFVVQVLENVFGKTYDEALKLVIEIHHNGRAVCGIYTPEQASRVVDRVAQLARRNLYPLSCIAEPTS